MIKYIYCVPVFAFILSFFYGSQAIADCHADDELRNPYQKRLVVTGFPILNPEQSILGALGNLEVRLAQIMAADINRRGQQVAIDYSHVDLKNLGLSGQQYADQFSRTGLPLDQLGLPDTQFVLTGMIENMDSASDKAFPWYRRYAGRTVGLVYPRYNQARQFALTLELVDLYRGEMIWQQRFVRHGNWSRKRGEATGVDNPLFWKTGYGKQVRAVIKEATKEVQTVLACQPLMVRLDQVRDDYVRMPAFAARQIQAGVELRLFKQNQTKLNLVAGTSKVVEINPDQGEVRLQGASMRDFKVGDLVSLN